MRHTIKVEMSREMSEKEIEYVAGLMNEKVAEIIEDMRDRLATYLMDESEFTREEIKIEVAFVKEDE